MRRGKERAAAMDGLGTSDHEPCIFGGWQGFLERTRLSLRRRIPPPRGRRPNEKNATPRREADGRLQHRSARQIDVASSRCYPERNHNEDKKNYVLRR